VSRCFRALATPLLLVALFVAAPPLTLHVVRRAEGAPPVTTFTVKLNGTEFSAKLPPENESCEASTAACILPTVAAAENLVIEFGLKNQPPICGVVFEQL